MKIVIILGLIALVLAEKSCAHDAVKKSTNNALRQFGVKLFKAAAEVTNNNFVMSQYSVYLTLAAMAESAVGKTREELFETLQLPSEENMRYKFYEHLFEAIRESKTKNFNFEIKRVLAFDESLQLNQTWVNQIAGQFHILPKELPINKNPISAADDICRISSLHFSDFHFNSNSVLYESVIYEGTWAAAFPDSKIKHAALFYDDFGYAKATADFLSFKQRVHFASLPEYKIKAIALPVSHDDERYKMVFILNTDNKPISHTIEHFSEEVLTKIIDCLEETQSPLEVDIPKLNVTFIDHNLRGIFERLGVKSLWTTPADTGYISNPAAMPSSYVQNVAVRLDPEGLTEYNEEYSAPSAQDQESCFMLNRPFLYALLDTRHKIYLYSGAYSGEDEVYVKHQMI